MDDPAFTNPITIALACMESDSHSAGGLGQVCRQHPQVLQALKDDKPLLLFQVLKEISRVFTTGVRQNQLAELLRELVEAGALQTHAAHGVDWLLMSIHPTFGTEPTAPRLLIQAGLPVTDEHLEAAGAMGCWGIVPDLVAAGANPANVPGLLGMALQESCRPGAREALPAAYFLLEEGRAALAMHPPRMRLGERWTPSMEKSSPLVCWDLLLSLADPFCQSHDVRAAVFKQAWLRIKDLEDPTRLAGDSILREMVVNAFGANAGARTAQVVQGSHWVHTTVSPVWDDIVSKFSHEEIDAWLKPAPGQPSVLVQAMRAPGSAQTPQVWRSWFDKLVGVGGAISTPQDAEEIPRLLVKNYGAALVDSPLWHKALEGVPLKWEALDEQGYTATETLAESYRRTHAREELPWDQCLSAVRVFLLSLKLEPSAPAAPRLRM